MSDYGRYPGPWTSVADRDAYYRGESPCREKASKVSADADSWRRQSKMEPVPVEPLVPMYGNGYFNNEMEFIPPLRDEPFSDMLNDPPGTEHHSFAPTAVAMRSFPWGETPYGPSVTMSLNPVREKDWNLPHSEEKSSEGRKFGWKSSIKLGKKLLAVKFSVHWRGDG